jgi:hypothetical protein
MLVEVIVGVWVAVIIFALGMSIYHQIKGTRPTDKD